MGVQCLLDCLSRVWCLSGYKITNKWTNQNYKSCHICHGNENDNFFAEVVTVKMVKINGYYPKFTPKYYKNSNEFVGKSC